jgi:hypothetical protein
MVSELAPRWCQNCHPKTKRENEKEKTKHEMAPSREGAFLDAFLNEEEKGFQEGGRGNAETNLNPSAEPTGSREELEAAVAHADAHLNGMTQ